jgi:hypothetical protein
LPPPQEVAVKAARPPAAGAAATLPGDLEVLQRLQGVPGVPHLVGLCTDAWGQDALMTAPVGEVLEWRVWDKQSVLPAPLHTLAGGLVQTLQRSHGLGVINRDVRPSNIIIAGEQGAQQQQLVIIDWGFAVQCKAGAPRFRGPYSGTIAYASDSVLQQYAGSGGCDVAVGPEDDLVSLVRCAFAVVHPSARMKLRVLDRGGAAGVLGWWRAALACRPRWLEAQAAAEQGAYASVQQLLVGLME